MLKTALLALFVLGSIGCGGDDDPPIEPAEGTFSLTWELEQGGAAVNCEDVLVDEIEVLVTPVGGSQGIADQFVCSDYAGTTFPYETGDYTIQVNALSADVAVATGDAFEEVLLEGDNQLGHFVVLIP